MTRKLRIFTAFLLSVGWLFATPAASIATSPELIVTGALITCANSAGETHTATQDWNASNSFFDGKGDIPRVFCELGFIGEWTIYVSDNYSGPARFYNGINPNPSPSPSPSQSPSPTATEPSSANSVSGTVNENGNLTLTAPSGNVFTSVVFANYGLPNNYTANPQCSLDVTSQVSSIFLGNSTGSIRATNSIAGDPCSGVGKRLSVTLNYSASTATSTPSPTPTPTPSPTPEDLTIGAPTNLSISDGATAITLAWNAPTDGTRQPERYAISFNCSGCNGWGIATGNVGDANALRTTITIDHSLLNSLRPAGTVWSFHIRSDNDTLRLYSANSNAVTSSTYVAPTPSPTPAPSPEPTPAPSPSGPTAEEIAAQAAAELSAQIAEAARLQAEAAALIAQQAAAAQAEANRIAEIAAAKAEADRLEAELAAKEAEDSAAKAEEEARVQAEIDAKAEADRVAAEKEAAEKAEADRILEEQREKDEADRLAQEEANAKAEAEAEAQAEEDRIAEEEKIRAEEEAKEQEAKNAEAEKEAEIAEEKAAEAELKEIAEEAKSGKELTEEQKDIVVAALIKTLAPGESISVAEVVAAGVELKDLPPDTPIEVRTSESGEVLIITAEVAANIELVTDPGALVEAIFTDPQAALAAIGSIGADMTEEERKEATEMVVATVVATGAALNAVGAATGTTGGSTGGNSGGSGGGGASGDSKGIRRRRP